MTMPLFNPLPDLLLRSQASSASCLSTPATSTKQVARPRWVTTLGLAISLASVAMASQVEELPEPTVVADLELAPLGDLWYRKPKQTPAARILEEDSEQLLLDTRVPYMEGTAWTMLHPKDHELRRRATTSDESVTMTFEITISTATTTSLTSSTSKEASTTSTDSDSSSTTSATQTSATATASSSPLPVFFDGGLSNNFTSETCPTFIDNMIAAEEFNACYPISLLLQGSNSFFQAEKSLVSMSTVLDHACQSNATGCASYLATVASNLTKSENCGDDYNQGNPTVTQAYTGLIAYQVVYSATCLKDDDTAVYCFGNAVTNTTNPSETYFYYLPLNSSLPGGTNPTCDGCLKDTMQIYQIATANRRQPIAYTYQSAASQVNTMCGPTFANASLSDAITTSGAYSTASQGPSTWFLLLTTLFIAAMNWLI